MAEIVVVGAGPAGLMAALCSARNGHRCTLMEATDTVGGMAASFDVAGQRVDHGSHRLHPATPQRFMDLFASRLGDDLQLRPRRGRILLGGRWIAFPLRAADMLRNLPPAFATSAAIDTAAACLRRLSNRPSDSFAAEIRRRLGPTVARGFYEPYARKLYGCDPDDLDSELARRRVSASGAGDVLKRVLSAASPKAGGFWYPRRGYGQLSETLADAAVEAGATLRLRTRVLGLEPADGAVLVRSEAGALRADAVLTTMPAPALAEALDPPPPEAVTAALRRCRNRGVVLVYLVLGRERFTTWDAHYFPGSETVISRLSEPKNYRSGDDPPDVTVLCAEIPCWPGDETWQSSDSRLAELVAAELAAVGLEGVEPLQAEVRRLPAVYPVYEKSSMSDRATVDVWLRSLAGDGVVSLGRHGLGVLDNLHHVLAMGESAVRCIDRGGKVDLRAWGRCLEGFASHVVED
ncbi:MAG: FAD-dependent oxidoreductase [Acidimicrobiaceae bacterium]|nr:FAD-dependent oxidoreductase [Acidimicrobiaceae bacterium]MCY4175433.1 FAD-dependent oxidoreductase [Acidimicrobiaceae bacterium]MCY4279576.1 FAD-dependent oxidoreductase [Acidimicrobiaceae bacterium]MCY4293493.1 FAD-dependent oxidoreductase [Acidimicrobiaceae bacterium]